MIPNDVKPKHTDNKTKPHEPLSFLSLPEEIIENILARISKWEYPNLSLVSKRFLSLLSSPQLYKTRSYIGTTEPCLYFCLKLPEHPSPQWFTLWMQPKDETDEVDNYDIADDYLLVPVPCHLDFHHVPYCSTIAVGSEIYLIGGPFKGPPSTAVRILDCWSHKWRDGPSMLVARTGASAFFLDEKIYVMGGSEKDDSWMEVFDIKTHTWSPLLSHGELRSEEYFLHNTFKGKIYAIAVRKDYAYDPKKDAWDVVKTHSSFGHIDAWCELEGVMYCFTNSGFCMWYDSESSEWREVKGADLILLREHDTCNVSASVHEMFNFGGKLLVIWVPTFEEYKAKPERRIWCATIGLEKRHDGEIWGELEWANTVLTVSKSYMLLSCVVISI